MREEQIPPNTEREEDSTGVRFVDHSQTMRDRNMVAYETWDMVGARDGRPLPPDGSGCRVYSCWTPCAPGHDYCARHGGKDAVPVAGGVAISAAAPRALILARIRELGQAEVARLVAPAWGWSPDSAASRLTRWMKEPGEKGFKDMSSEALFALICALGLTIVRVDEEKT